MRVANILMDNFMVHYTYTSPTKWRLSTIMLYVDMSIIKWHHFLWLVSLIIVNLKKLLSLTFVYIINQVYCSLGSHYSMFAHVFLFIYFKRKEWLIKLSICPLLFCIGKILLVVCLWNGSSLSFILVFCNSPKKLMYSWLSLYFAILQCNCSCFL